MKKKLFMLFDGINREGLDNSYWTMFQDVETVSYFGSFESIDLHGQYVGIYRDSRDDYYYFIHGMGLAPKYTLTFSDSEQILDIYPL